MKRSQKVNKTKEDFLYKYIQCNDLEKIILNIEQFAIELLNTFLKSKKKQPQKIPRK